MEKLLNYLQTMGVDTRNPSKLKCPIHKDDNPSAGIYQGSDDKYRFSCRVCGITEDYKGLFKLQEGKYPPDEQNELIGYSMDSKQALKKPDRQTFTIEQLRSWKNLYKCYEYSDDFTVIRTNDKKFFQFKSHGFDWVYGAPSKTPLWGDPESAVFLVEGEKAVEALKHVGIASVTTAGGANGFKKADLTPLKGREIVIWPDNDDAGQQYARGMKEKLKEVGCIAEILDISLMMLPEKGDSADFVRECLRDFNKEEVREEIEALLETVSFRSFGDDFVNQKIADFKSGALKSLPTDWLCLQDTKWLQGGTVTLVCAPPGVGKSWFVHNLSMMMMESGVDCKNIQLEEDQAYHISRLMQIKFGGNFTDPDSTTEEDINKLIQHKEMLNRFSDVIKTMPDDKMKLTDIAEQVREYAEGGAKVIIIDPISVAEKSQRSWEDDLRFVNSVKRTVRIHKIRLILVTHPKGGQSKEFSLDSISGGTAYQRLSQCALFIVDLPAGTQKNYLQSNGTVGYGEANRMIISMKHRNAVNLQSNKILFNFKNGKFIEKGFLVDINSENQIS